MTGAVTLREVRKEDLPTFFDNQLNPEANRMGAFTPRDHDTFMAHWTKILADDRVVIRTVLVDGQVAGNIMSFERDGRRQVGYWIGREFWGRGVATDALLALLAEIDKRPLYAYVAKQNVASIRVLEKCGFSISEEGVGSDGVEEFILTLSD